MTDLKKSLKDYGLNILRELLGGKPAEPGAKKASLDDISEQDLQQEKVRFDFEYRKMDTHMQTAEAQKRKLFEAAVHTKSERERLVLAREIKEKEEKSASIQRNLNVISKQRRMINALILLKERRASSFANQCQRPSQEYKFARTDSLPRYSLSSGRSAGK